MQEQLALIEHFNYIPFTFKPNAESAIIKCFASKILLPHVHLIGTHMHHTQLTVQLLRLGVTCMNSCASKPFCPPRGCSTLLQVPTDLLDGSFNL